MSRIWFTCYGRSSLASEVLFGQCQERLLRPCCAGKKQVQDWHIEIAGVLPQLAFGDNLEREKFQCFEDFSSSVQRITLNCFRLSVFGLTRDA